MTGLEAVEPFEARRAVERLRSGLFDPLVVRLMTAGGERLAAVGGFDESPPDHLCVCGAYGQGKSHSLQFLMDRALEHGYAASMVTLDPREIPFHRPRLVYRALLRGLRFPDGEQDFVRRWRAVVAERSPGDPEALLPEGTPRGLRLELGALVRPTDALSPAQRAQKQHRNYNPRAFPHHLRRALAGEVVPVNRVRHALRYRQVPDRRGPLAWRGSAAMLARSRALARLLQDMGLKGWMTLFDEGESMAQVRSTSRRNAWEALSLWTEPAPGLLPVFAFTEDLLQRMEEDGEGALRRRLKVYTLGDLSPADWRRLSGLLGHLHGRAYGWRPDPESGRADLERRLAALGGVETRLALKALVDELDLQEQARR